MSGFSRPMRIPQSWDDRDILQDEPLCSAFREQKSSRCKGWTFETKDPLIQLLRRENSKSVQAWLDHAFSHSSSRPSKVVVDYSTANIFLGFFWSLYENNDSSQALKLLNSKRRGRGLPNLSVNAVPWISSTDSAPADIKKEILPQDISPPTVLPNRSRNETAISLTKPVITSTSSSSIQNLPFPSHTTSKTINPSTSHVREKHSLLSSLPFTKIVKVEDSASDSALTLVHDPEMRPALPPLLPVAHERNPSPISKVPATCNTSGTALFTKVTLIPNVAETHSPLSLSSPTYDIQVESSSNIPEKKPVAPLDGHEAKRHAKAKIGILKETRVGRTDVVKGKDKSRSKKDRPSSTATMPRKSLRSNKIIKTEDSYPNCISNPEMNSDLPPLALLTGEADHDRITFAPTLAKTSETSRDVPKKKPVASLENHEGKFRANTIIDTPKETHLGGMEVSAKSKKIGKGKDLSQPNRGRPPSTATVPRRKSLRSNNVTKTEDSVSTLLPNLEVNSELPPLVPVAKGRDHKPIPVVSAALETSGTPQVWKQKRYDSLHFRKVKDNGHTLLPNSEINSELPPSVPLANGYDHSTISVTPTALETSSNVPEKRLARSLDNLEARQHINMTMDTPMGTNMQETEVGVSSKKVVKVKGISRSKRGRLSSTATSPRRSLRSNVTIRTEDGSILVPNPGTKSDTQLASECGSSSASTRQTTSDNPSNVPKKRPSTPSSGREAKRRAISEKGTAAEMHVHGMEPVENPRVTNVGKMSQTGRVPRARKKRHRTEAKADAKTQVIETSVSVSTQDVAMNIEEIIRIKAEALDNYEIYSSESNLPPMLQHQESDNEDESMFLLADLCKEELEPDWIRPLFPNGFPEDYYQFPKPPIRNFPPIWAESRQELCESFDWFRSYQGGVYHAHNVAKGYLLSAFPSSRDIFEHGGRLIISHGGGRAESLHSSKGQITSQPATDQMAQDKSVRALFDNYLNNRPLALVMDDKYALFPFDLRAKGIAYAVLGFYTIAHAWAEYQPANNETGRVVRYKFAFRWCEQQGSPWWNQELEENGELPTTTNIQSPLSASENFLSDHFYEPSVIMERKNLALVCKLCHKFSLRVFDLSWACLNPHCKVFWRKSDGKYLPIHLDYHHNFLQLPPSRSIPAGFGDLEPASPLSFLPGDNITNYAFTRGFHCPSCGRLSCRVIRDKWEKWECMNPDCRHSLIIRCPPRDAKEFLYQTESMGFKDHSINGISEIVQLPPASFAHEYGRGILHTFLLAHDGAKIHHIQSGNALGRKEADVIFRDYQIQATSGSLKFRRWPMRAHKCRGALLTNYFSQNSGEPYKYVGGDANTVPFESAPEAVVKARALIQRRINQALGISSEFNEVLSAAYMERQRMAFHSDNEVGLGPLVAGLSLGSPALMHFRLHAKHDPEREKRGILLSIVLRHGDILVMDGAGVQEYYEHTVVPDNFRIAATARQINAGHI